MHSSRLAAIAIGVMLAALLGADIAHAALALPPGQTQASIFDLTPLQVKQLTTADLPKIAEVAIIKKVIMIIAGAIVAGAVFFLAYRYMTDNERFNGMLVGQVLGGALAVVAVVAFAMDNIILFILKRMAG